MQTQHLPPRGRHAVLVTGASRAIGRAVALHLADRGECVLAVDMSLAGAEDLPRETAAGGLLETALMRDGDPASCRAALAQAEALFGRLDAVVVGPGTPAFGALEETDDDDAARVFADNIFAPVTLIREAIKVLRPQGRGMIICVGSAAGRLALPLSSLLSASHHALEGLCDALRLELRPFGVHVSLVEPGLVRSPVASGAIERIEAALGTLPHAGPYARIGGALVDVLRELTTEAVTPREVAAMVHRALTARSPRARYTVSRRTARWLWARRVLPERVIDGRIARALGIQDE